MLLAVLVLFGLQEVYLAVPSSAVTVDPSQSIANMQSMIKPAIAQASDWGIKAGLGLVSAQAFYALLVRMVRG